MSSEAPVNAGHRFATSAEDYEEKEEWIKAAETHSKASEQFEIAMKDTTDQEAIRTLKLLALNHSRKAVELKRKANRIIANQQKADQLTLNDKQNQRKNNLIRLVNINEQQKMSEISESYALLPNGNPEEDPFNKFLEAVEGLVQQLFNPAVAFTSVPLNENDKPIPSKIPMTNMLDSYCIVPNPSGTEILASSEREQDVYTTENEKLKLQLSQLKKKLHTLQLSAEENNLLKSSVLQFRSDVQKQAKRIIMQSHHESLRSSAIGPNSSLVHSTRLLPLHHSNNLALKLKELEEENKQLMSQHEKQKALINIYKERWGMIKENAKKRRASTLNSSIQDNVDE